MTEKNKSEFLKKEIRHFDIKSADARPFIAQFGDMAFQARNLARACRIYDRMLSDTECAVILCLAGSIFSAGLRKTVFDMLENNMVDAVVSTGAVIVDQDFFEALGFRHYRGSVAADDNELMNLSIDRIYDTYIDEDQLRVCDSTIKEIADTLDPRPYSSREFIGFMGEYLRRRQIGEDSLVRIACEKDIPVFVPAFSDSSAGFGLVEHRHERGSSPSVSIDSVKDFHELTRIKTKCADTALLMIGGGVPKNFAQDITVAADIIGQDSGMHKYAVQITVADERDGGLSGSTLKEAHSWGKVDEGQEQMVFSEATVALPLLASSAYHGGAWKNRSPMRLNRIFTE